MWASYIRHKIRLGKFSQVDYSHGLTIWSRALLYLSTSDVMRGGKVKLVHAMYIQYNSLV